MEKTLYQHEYRILLELLKEARLVREVNQTELAERLGITQSIVSKCERGERRLDIIELRQWCQAIDVPFGLFVERFEEALVKIPGKPAREVQP